MLYSTQTDFLVRKYGIDAGVDMLIEAGFPALDYSMFSLTEAPFTDDYREVAARIKAKADAAGVRFVQAHAPFNSKRAFTVENIVPKLPRVFEFASLLGIKNIVVHPIQDGKYYGNEQRIFDLNVEFYKSLAPEAKKWGVRIAIENMWQRHYVAGYICDDILADPYELARMYDTLNDPEAFTVCLDLGHVALCGREPEDAIRILGSRIGCLHVHDVDYVSDLHTLPGVSKLHWDNILRALADVGYSGSFNLEADAFYYGFIPEQYKLAARYMNDITRVYAEKLEEYKRAK